MDDLTTLQARLVSLKRARDSGVLSLRHGDTNTSFRSLAEMNEIIAALEAEIQAAGGAVRAKRGPRYVTQRSKGFGRLFWD